MTLNSRQRQNNDFWQRYLMKIAAVLTVVNNSSFLLSHNMFLDTKLRQLVAAEYASIALEVLDENFRSFRKGVHIPPLGHTACSLDDKALYAELLVTCLARGKCISSGM